MKRTTSFLRSNLHGLLSTTPFWRYSETTASPPVCDASHGLSLLHKPQQQIPPNAFAQNPLAVILYQEVHDFLQATRGICFGSRFWTYSSPWRQGRFGSWHFWIMTWHPHERNDPPLTASINPKIITPEFPDMKTPPKERILCSFQTVE